MRRGPDVMPVMLGFLVICVALGQGVDAFLGTQGDPWDTQSDMFFALLGAISALLVLSRRHDAELERLGLVSPATP